MVHSVILKIICMVLIFSVGVWYHTGEFGAQEAVFMANTTFVTPGDDLQAVFDAARAGGTIRLAEGTYRCKAVIRTPGLHLIGAGADGTRIVWDDYARKIDSLGREYITFRTYTLAVCADGVTMEDLAIVNDAGQPERKGQQLALSVVMTAKRLGVVVLRVIRVVGVANVKIHDMHAPCNGLGPPRTGERLVNIPGSSLADAAGNLNLYKFLGKVYRFSACQNIIL